MVTDSKLRGRGGAGFSTGRKWSFMPLGDEIPGAKYIACNADEMEPGCFKDRILMEQNPHLLLEGILLAGYATQATAGYIFLRANYEAPWAALRAAPSPRPTRPATSARTCWAGRGASSSTCTRAAGATCAARPRPCSTRSKAGAPSRAGGRRT